MPSLDTRGGAQSCLNLMCHALYKSTGGLPLSEQRWEEWIGKGADVKCVRVGQKERRKGKLQSVCKINGKKLFQ